jgi:hypothetical protein
LNSDTVTDCCDLFLDESGQVDGGSREDAYRDYLALFGCAIWRKDFVEAVKPGFTRLKETIFKDRASEIVLHRRDIVYRSGPFAVLRDPEKKKAFDEGLLELLRDLPYTAIAVVVHKSAVRHPPGTRFANPYHFALALILERFCGYVRVHGSRGAVVIESRGKRDDQRLKETYEVIRRRGTRFHPPEHFAETLFASPVFRRKLPAVAGLELADLCAHPAKLDVLADHGRAGEAIGFPAQLREILAGKYNRRISNDRVAGYGKVFFTWPKDAG